MNEKLKQKKQIKANLKAEKKNEDIVKRLKALNYNQEHYDELRNELIQNAKKISNDILENYYLPENFDFNKLNFELIRPVHLQDTILPYSNKQLSDLISMPKIAINELINENDKGRNVHATFLLGKQNDKYVLFLLSIDKSPGYENDFIDFHIRLCAYVQGKTWLNLLRLDSFGNPHRNFIANDKVASYNEVWQARTPHLHRADEKCIVLSKNPNYTIAHELDFLDYSSNMYNDKFLFKKCMDYFLKLTNTKININPLVKNDYHYNFSKPLFEFNTSQIENLKDIKSKEGGVLNF